MEMIVSTRPRARMSEGMTRAIAWLTAWDSQGIHRTATAGDEAGAEWLAREAADLGATPAIEEFALDRLDPIVAYLEFDGRRVPGVPIFDAPATGPDGVSGILGRVGEETSIAVAELSPLSVYSPDYEEVRRNVVHRGLVILCKGKRSGLGLLNAERFRHPYGAPAVHIPSDAGIEVLAASARRASVRLVSTNCRVPTRACNVVVIIYGKDRSRAPVVVMTPRSSWWQSTSERGGGLVCWLESLRALVASPPLCDVIFTANSGHELGHLGLDEFMGRRPGWEQPVAEGGAVWVHYGANIGAVGGELSIQSTSDDLRAMAMAELTRAGRQPDRIAPKTLAPSGETRDIHRAGGCYLTLVGSNPLFHLPQDRWPHAVDSGAVARIAAAASHLVVRLTRWTNQRGGRSAPGKLTSYERPDTC
jgi:hypothetical protein